MTLHFAELHIGSSIRYKNTLVGNYFLKCNEIKRILISSFNCFSEYNLPSFNKVITHSLTFFIAIHTLYRSKYTRI